MFMTAVCNLSLQHWRKAFEADEDRGVCEVAGSVIFL